MSRYRKRPIVIEAMQWSLASYAEVCSFMGRERIEYDASCRAQIETLEGTVWASQGDWIIKGIRGEYYPCKPDIFLATYERVTEATQ